MVKVFISLGFIYYFAARVIKMSQQTQRKITTLPDHNHHGKKIWCKKSFFGNPVFNKTRQLFLDPSTHFALNFVEIPLISISCSDWKKPTPSLHFPLMQIWKFNMESFPFQFKFIKYDVSVRRSDGNFQFIIPNCEYSLCFKFHLPLADSKIDEIPPNFFSKFQFESRSTISAWWCLVDWTL